MSQEKITRLNFILSLLKQVTNYAKNKSRFEGTKLTVILCSLWSMIPNLRIIKFFLHMF